MSHVLNASPHTMLLVLSVSVLLALSGCGDSEFNFDPYVGTDGVTISFLEHAPPEELLLSRTGEPVELGIQVANLGAHDIPTAFLTLATEEDYLVIESWDIKRADITPLGGSQQRIAFPLPGKSAGNPFGMDEVFTAFAHARIPDPQIETLETQVLASVCYPYRTLLHTPVCVDTDPNNFRNRRKSCTVEDLSFSGQGSPVRISDIRVQMLSATTEFLRPQFTITIENAGDGTVLTGGVDALSIACSSAPVPREFFGAIELVDIQLSGFSLQSEQFECQPLPIRLDDSGSAIITCTLKSGLLRSGQDTYSTDLAIELTYGYLQTSAVAFRLRQFE